MRRVRPVSVVSLVCVSWAPRRRRTRPLGCVGREVIVVVRLPSGVAVPLFAGRVRVCMCVEGGWRGVPVGGARLGDVMVLS